MNPRLNGVEVLSDKQFLNLLDKEDIEKQTTKQIIESAIEKAIEKGVKVIPGGVFNWCGDTPNLPKACNAVGAVLLAAGKENLVGANGFDPKWLDQLAALLHVEKFWIMRFNAGFDYGNEIILSSRKDCGLEGAWETELTKEKVSAYGAKLARKCRQVNV